MFDTLKMFLGRWKKKMIPYDKIKEMTGEDIPFYSEMERNTRLWYSLYKNKPPWSCGVKTDRNIISIGLPSAITRELAKPAVIESKITIQGGQKAIFLQNQIDVMMKELRHNLEKGLAFGNMIYRPYLYDNQIGIACHFFDTFFPVAFDERGILTQVVFLQKIKNKNNWYVILEHHKLENSIYTIQSKAFLSNEQGLIGQEIPLKNIKSWQNVSDNVAIGGIEKPLFGFFKTPFGNNIDDCSNMGVSVYSSAVDLIKQADEQWEALQWEYKSGERKLFISPEALQIPGNKQNTDRLFRQLDIEEKGFYQEFSPAFRDSNLYNGLQTIYKMIEFNTGLSYGVLSDPQTVAMTATEIESSKQRMYATVFDIQNALENTISDLVYAVSTLADLYQLAPNDEYEILFDWGDGIIKDTQAQQEELEHMRADVAAGLLKPELYIMKKYNVDESTAKSMMVEQSEVTEVY
ncbi:MAG: phage capsid protein [Firmicutes bacterium]|jgi:A118 family predicted phage portal protein|nr:phage capsid protein [Bacillota bacterium]